MSEIYGKDQINIRSKPTKVPEIEQEIMPPSPELINDDLRAATAAVVVKMDSVDSVPSNKFKVKDPTPRSPAPMPEAVSPAGVPIDLNVPETKDIPSSPKSVRGEFKIDLEGVDTTVEGMKPTEYKRNVKGSVVVIGLLLLSLHLFLNHLTMFTWVVNFDSPEQVIAAVLYFISTIIIIVMFLTALAVPALSIQEDKFKAYYSPILVAGLIDYIAIVMGGGIFSPLSIYTLDPTNSSFYNGVAALITLLINGFLYYAFTRRPEDGKLFAMVHPFEKISEEETIEEEIDEKEITEGQCCGLMESAISSIETLLNEGSELVKLAQDRCSEYVFDSKGKRANYTSLVERVNGLGASLAQIKNEIEEFSKEKRELMEMVEKLENADVKEIQKLAAILNKS